MIGLAGVPELEEGDDLGRLLAEPAAASGGLEPGDVVVVAQKAVSKVGGPDRAARRDRAVRRARSSWRGRRAIRGRWR